MARREWAFRDSAQNFELASHCATLTGGQDLNLRFVRNDLTAGLPPDGRSATPVDSVRAAVEEVWMLKLGMHFAHTGKSANAERLGARSVA